jgi:sulfoxide reductase heme-binding subunit YedZ
MAMFKSWEESIRWNYPTILNLTFLVLAAVLAIRFFRTGAPEMLRMMSGSGHHEHTTVSNIFVRATIIMPRTSYWIQRSKRHFVLAVAAVAIIALAYAATPPPDLRHRLSMATAYAGLIFLAASLWLGPWNVLRRRPNPTSFDVRRDVGVWTGILAIVHTAIGLTVHLRGRMWMYFFKGLHPLKLQNTQFGFANFTGLGAALLFLMLFAISNDLSLRTLKVRRWKSLQRWTYIAFLLTGAHGIAFQVIEKRHVPWIVVFAAIMTAVVILQFVAFVQVHWRLRAQTLTAASRIPEERSPQP